MYVERSDFLKEINKVLDLTAANYEHLFIMGDLNSKVKEKYLANRVFVNCIV